MIELTNADIAAIDAHDHIYLNNKGAGLYRKENYEAAVEYYRLAAAMGNLNSVSNLGLSLGGSMGMDVETAYIFLRKAKAGYETMLANGSKMYQESYDGVTALLADPQFDLVRKNFDDDDDE